MSSKFFRGTSLLKGSATAPGHHLSEHEKEIYMETLRKCRDYGCDFYPTVIQKVDYDEMSEIAAYGGFPRRWPHWKWGMEFENLQRGYEHNNYRIYEMVINNDPCYIYVMTSNTLMDNVLVVAHATGHNDFFKNNVNFDPTMKNALNKFANHGIRIQKYMDRWGIERVTEFIDNVLRIETLIDPAKAWDVREPKESILKDKRDYEFPRTLDVKNDRLHMHPWLNPDEWRERQLKKIKEAEIAKELGMMEKPEKDIFGYIRDHAPLKPWQQDIISMLYEESMYYVPQRATKTINEGWASFIDFEILARQGLVSLGQKSDDCGIIEYGMHKSGVLGGKYSMNPYKIGFYLLRDIEERWNKGRFGTAYEECNNIRQKEEWDLNLGLGKEKLFQVRKTHNDLTLIMEFFDQEFCDTNEFFEWKKYPNGEYRIENRDAKVIKKKLMARHSNGGLPDIRLVDGNHRGQNIFFMQHMSDERPLYDPYARSVLSSINYLMQKEIMLSTKDSEGEKIYICNGPDEEKDVIKVSRQEYEDSW